jgi:orotidine-5'-phosphate decarboxylase
LSARDRLFVALDTPDAAAARGLVDRLSGHVGGFKVGLELFVSNGPELVREIRRCGAAVFLDLKLHDIANTVAGAAAAIARLGASYFTLHASGGPKMIADGVEAARRAATDAGLEPPTALAVSVLTSLDDDALERIGLRGPCRSAVLRLAEVARDAGAGGLVCSPLEVAAVRERFPGGTLVVPGIRPGGGDVTGDDQRRVATPRRAIAMGADLLVLGRPITRADDPAAAADAIVEEIGRGLADRDD